MTLTELRYIVAVKNHRHFGKAAASCYVSQPTLSVGIKKLEDELKVTLFERGHQEIIPTAVGEEIITIAETILQNTTLIKELANQESDPINGSLRIGVIYTISPYVLPQLVKSVIEKTPQMPLILTEDYTHRLLDKLRNHELDAILIADPIDGMHNIALYKEPFWLATNQQHPWAKRSSISPEELQDSPMLLLGTGHCLREQIINFCTHHNIFIPTHDLQRSVVGSSLETIRQMVASGLGITILPALALQHDPLSNNWLHYIPFEAPTPFRTIYLVARKSFPRKAAIYHLTKLLHQSLNLRLVEWIADESFTN